MGRAIDCALTRRKSPAMITGETRLFPIIGDPIMSVQSPQRLTASLAGADKNAVCIPMQVAENDLAAVMSGLTAISNVDGLLITMPHKSAAHAYCSTSSPTSRLLGVVSVMRRNADGSWHGDMLDGTAFVNAQVKAGAKLQGARVLLLGAGGAGSAIAVAMLDQGIRELVIYDRNPAQAAKLVQLLPTPTIALQRARRTSEASTSFATLRLWA